MWATLNVLRTKPTCGPSAMFIALKKECFDNSSACDVTGRDGSPKPGGKDGGKAGGAPGWWRNGRMEENGGSCPGDG